MSRPVVIPDLPATRPATVGAARGLAERIYRENDWDEDEQAGHMRMIGIEPRPLAELGRDDLKKILDWFEYARMVIFAK